jgi:hypothetical protein
VQSYATDYTSPRHRSTHNLINLNGLTNSAIIIICRSTLPHGLYPFSHLLLKRHGPSRPVLTHPNLHQNHNVRCQATSSYSLQILPHSYLSPHTCPTIISRNKAAYKQPVKNNVPVNLPLPKSKQYRIKYRIGDLTCTA